MPMEKQFNTPVLFLIFNRPDTTKQVFESIRQIKPKQLFVAADGPRPDRIGEKEKCEAAREIIKQVDWDCEVKTRINIENKGCGIAPFEAITWFFDNVEYGIILEDDCLPDQSFFSFCQELLLKYRFDNRIMMISGDNFLKNITITSSYFFSKYHFIWGWASWKRAWKYCDFSMNSWKILNKTNCLKCLFPKRYERIWWKKIYEEVVNCHVDYWDYQWGYTIIINNGVTIFPKVNLVSNIGFSKSATHTQNQLSWKNSQEAKVIDFPLIHPKVIETNKYLDKKLFENYYECYSIFDKILNKIF
jgi:hypothetical protein